MSVLKMTESRVFNCHVAIDKVVKIGQSQLHQDIQTINDNRIQHMIVFS